MQKELRNLKQVAGVDMTTNAFFARVQEHRDRAAAMTQEQKDQEQAAAELEEKRSRIERSRWINRQESGLPKELWERRLRTCPVNSPSHEAAIKAADFFVQNFFDKVKVPKGYYFWGAPGRGKSGLAHCIINEILQLPRMAKVFYLPCWEIDEISKRIDIMRTIEESDLVVLDDLEKGLNNPSINFKQPSDKLLRAAINKADSLGHPKMIITSNYSISEIAAHWPPLGSRLNGLTKEYHIDGSDMREGNCR